MRDWENRTMKKVLIVLLFFVQGAYANVALDQIKESLNKASQKQEQKIAANRSIKDLQQHYYFVFFYRSTCPHCHKMAPVIKDFTESYQIPLQAISTDGGDIAGLKGERMTAEMFRTFFVSAGYKSMVPATFLVNRETNQAYAVMFGEATPYQLATRVDELMRHIKEQFNG